MEIPYRSDFARFHYAKGYEVGLAKAKAESWVGAILIVLPARGIAVTPDQESRIRQCTDLDQLDEWLQRAATADSADQVFG